ncbi:carcinoembryonic antigen-related cell adhesion molecule 21-like [Phyllostomus hastatus]|uniref:carcinoembryonic antigen-related cell adhesion molecule 21-like n=1 Tax=Phyllostomus hastatus TaxID=9423 RepID=UPI001E684ECA|nr:carcinoembryonic antigen-related cell adhesion molecule 21-like [Phyllostomus hastatus]
MGFLSIFTHRGFIHCQGLLLVVSLLNSWSQPSTARMTVESVDALERTDVILHIRHRPRNAEYFLWYRGTTIDFRNNIAYLSVKSGRHVRGPPGGQGRVEDDGSLLLKNVSVEDSGIYIVMVQLQGCQKMIACGHLTVYPLVSVPTLQASKTTVTAKKDAVVFTCHTNYDAIQWLFKGISLPLSDRMQLSVDRRNLTIDPVLIRDAGDYQCKAYNPRSSGKSAPLKLDVKFA